MEELYKKYDIATDGNPLAMLWNLKQEMFERVDEHQAKAFELFKEAKGEDKELLKKAYKETQKAEEIIDDYKKVIL